MRMPKYSPYYAKCVVTQGTGLDIISTEYLFLVFCLHLSLLYVLEHKVDAPGWSSFAQLNSHIISTCLVLRPFLPLKSNNLELTKTPSSPGDANENQLCWLNESMGRSVCVPPVGKSGRARASPTFSSKTETPICTFCWLVKVQVNHKYVNTLIIKVIALSGRNNSFKY